MKFTNPPLSIEAQVDLLVSRGMSIPDHARACCYLSLIRNLAAHHSRLWTRRLTVTMRLSRRPQKLSNEFNHSAERKVYNTLVMLGYLLKIVSPGTSWVKRLRNLLEEYPQVNPLLMGFPEGWRERESWRRVG